MESREQVTDGIDFIAGVVDFFIFNDFGSVILLIYAIFFVAAAVGVKFMVLDRAMSGIVRTVNNKEKPKQKAQKPRKSVKASKAKPDKYKTVSGYSDEYEISQEVEWLDNTNTN